MQSLNLLEPIITAAAAANPMNPGDFMQDGLLYCGKCKTAKQCRQLRRAGMIDKTDYKRIRFMIVK